MFTLLHIRLKITCFHTLVSKYFVIYTPTIAKKGPYTLSNDPGEVDSSFFCYAATVLSPHRNVLIFTQRMHKPT